MKQILPKILSIAALLLLIVSLYRTVALETLLHSTESNLTNQIQQLQSNINSLHYNIETILEKEASLLSAHGWEYGKADLENQSVELLCSVTPKEYSVSKTTAILISGTHEYPMELQNGAFVITVDLPMFTNLSEWKVQFQEDDIIRTELLDWYLSPRYDYLPTLYASVDGGAYFNTNTKDNVIVYTRDQLIHVDINASVPFDVQSATMIEVLDGKEIKRIPIDITPRTIVAEESEVSSVSESVTATSVDYDRTSHYYYDTLTDPVEFPFGSTWELYVEVVDSYGLHHRALIDRQIIDETGEVLHDEEEWSWRNAEASIYNTNGALLWGV